MAASRGLSRNTNLDIENLEEYLTTIQDLDQLKKLHNAKLRLYSLFSIGLSIIIGGVLILVQTKEIQIAMEEDKKDGSFGMYRDFRYCGVSQVFISLGILIAILAAIGYKVLIDNTRKKIRRDINNSIRTAFDNSCRFTSSFNQNNSSTETVNNIAVGNTAIKNMNLGASAVEKKQVKKDNKPKEVTELDRKRASIFYAVSAFQGEKTEGSEIQVNWFVKKKYNMFISTFFILRLRKKNSKFRSHQECYEIIKSKNRCYSLPYLSISHTITEIRYQSKIIQSIR